ncbi:MAG: MFS transporter [Lachnospiraceae bacterium]|jgi:GPH family glycoside/pentoside/hexuronide:cation symporter
MKKKADSAQGQAVRPFGFRDKIGYMFGDFGNDFTFMLSSMFLMKFYTDVMGVSAVIVGVMMMAARFVDALTDVAMGQIADRSKPTAKGKFAPWLRRMMGPVAVASFLMYATWFKDMPMTFKVVWMFATYLLWGSVCYTGINIPYGSMASVISDKPEDRAQLSTWRSIGGTLASMIISVVLPMIVYYKDAAGNSVFSGPRMTAAALLCSVAALVCYLLCYSMTTERVKTYQVRDHFSFKELFRITFANRSMIGIILAALLLLLAQLTLSSMGNYIYPNYFNNSSALSIVGLLATIITLGLSGVITKLSVKFGRKELATTGAVIGAASLFLAYFLHTHNLVVWIVLYMISNLGIAFFNITIWAMITDVIDDIEVIQHKRRDGTIYAVYSFARKLGQAASAGLSGALLTAVGYTSATAFDTAVTDGIYNITCLVPALGFVGVALVLGFVYPLSKKRVQANSAELQKRREET